jgi:hypothetical protein
MLGDEELDAVRAMAARTQSQPGADPLTGAEIGMAGRPGADPATGSPGSDMPR